MTKRPQGNYSNWLPLLLVWEFEPCWHEPETALVFDDVHLIDVASIVFVEKQRCSVGHNSKS